MKNKQGRREGEVWDACDELFGENRKLTLDQIQSKLETLGLDRGSPNYIYKYRKTWSDSKGITQEELKSLHHVMERETQRKSTNEEGIPKALLKSFSLYLREINQQSHDHYQPKINDLEAILKSEKEKNNQLENDCLSLKEKVAFLEQGLDEIRESKRQTDNELIQLHQNNSTLKHQLQAKEDFIQMLEQKNVAQINELKANAKARIEQLENSLQETNIQHKIEKEVLLNHQERERHKTMLEMDDLKVARHKVEQELSISLEKQQHLKQENQQFIQKISRLVTELNLINNDYQKLTQSHQKLKQRSDQEIHDREKALALIKGECNQLKQQLSDQNALYQRAQEKLLEQKEQLIRLEIMAEHKKENLEHLDTTVEAQ